MLLTVNVVLKEKEGETCINNMLKTNLKNKKNQKKQ